MSAQRVRVWALDGPSTAHDPPGLEDALRRLHEGRPGPANDDEDRPPPSTFPVTRAAREALRLSRERAV